jgi:nucleoside-diphosphate kinase
MASDERYVFIVEWYDTAASLIRTYNLAFYPKDKTIEMVDLKTKKLFLKRCEYPSIVLKDLYIGAIVTVHSRQLKVVDYADVYTRKAFESSKEKTFAMIKPDCYPHIGKIIDIIEHSGFVIGNIKMAKMTLADAEEFYAEHKGKPFYTGLTNFICSDFVVGMELVAEGAIAKWRKLIGPTNCDVARKEAPNSIRAIFGQEGVRNACHGSDSPGSAQREIDFFFGEKSKLKTTAVLNNCTCCVIKPHVVFEANAGRIIDQILSEGFEISALQMFFLDKATSEEFLEVYKGVLPEFGAMSGHLTTGPSIVLEVRQENAVNSFRDLCGPHDPEIAKTLRPSTLRAKFGSDRVKNAVHCTDLAEDGPLEAEYFFTVLQQK